MKIIFTVNTYYPLKDGVQFVTQYHAESLAHKGHEVIVITTNSCDKKEEIYNGVRIARFNINNIHAIYSGERKEYITYLLKEADSADAIINVCTQNPLTDWCFPILEKIKCKKILYMHGMYDLKFNFKIINNFSDFGHKIWNNIRWGLYYNFNKKIFKKYDRIIQLHNFDLAYLYFKKKYNIESKVIENAVDSSFFVHNEEREKYAICVANYMPRKNQELLLKAFYKSNIKGDFGLILIGGQNNSYYEKLINMQKNLESKFGKKNVKILYGIDRSETIRLIKRAYVYLLGSKWEAFPISIIEAMAAKVPFISTDVGIVKYLPGGVIANSEEEIIYWLNNFVSNDKLCEYYGLAGNAYAKEHMTIDKKAYDLEIIIREKS